MWSGKNQRGHRCPHRPLRSSRARGSLRSALRPGCAHQSHPKPERSTQVATLKKALEDWMVKTNDPLLEGKQTSAQDRKVANKALSSAKPADALIALEAPKTIVCGQKSVLKVKHASPADLGEKPIQVTLKGGGNERIERKEVKAAASARLKLPLTSRLKSPATKSSSRVLLAPPSRIRCNTSRRSPCR